MVGESCLATLGSARIYTLKIVVLPFIKLEYGPGCQLYGNSVNFWNKGLVSRNNNPLLLRQASICKNQGFEARNDKPLSFLHAITSKCRSVCSLGSTGGGCCTWLFHIKQKYCIHQHAFLWSNIQRWAFGSWSVRARGSQVGTSWTDVGRCLNFNMAGRCASCRGTGGGFCE